MGKMGRPVKPEAEKKTSLISLRVTADTIRAIDAAAKAAGDNRSDWIRKALTVAARAIQ